jgi:hypothetical protein
MQWILNLNTCIEQLAFDCNGQHILAKHLNQLIKVVNFVTNEVQTQVVEIMKNQMK